jgi:hypothetical protein
VSEPQDEGCSEVFIEEGGGPEEDEPLFEIDLGAFELVDTGISAEASENLFHGNSLKNP